MKNIDNYVLYINKIYVLFKINNVNWCKLIICIVNLVMEQRQMVFGN